MKLDKTLVPLDGSLLAEAGMWTATYGLSGLGRLRRTIHV